MKFYPSDPQIYLLKQRVLQTLDFKTFLEDVTSRLFSNMVFRFETFGAVFSTQIPCNSVQFPSFRTKF